jgi:SAM-dependent methyltransferase
VFDALPDDHLLLDGHCAVCDCPMQFRLGTEMWVPNHGFMLREALSCQTCPNGYHMNARMRAALHYMEDKLGLPKSASLYVTEKVTPLYRYLEGHFPNLEGSEFLPGEPLGAVVDGVRCEDLSRLTFGSAQFDAVLTFDVLEHVPAYRDAITEMARVLKRGGNVLMTVPICLERKDNVVRAVLNDDGGIHHIHPEVYHGNPLGPPSLWFTDFGWDLLEDFRTAGFVDVHIVFYASDELGYFGRPQTLILAQKP